MTPDSFHSTSPGGMFPIQLSLCFFGEKKLSKWMNTRGWSPDPSTRTQWSCHQQWTDHVTPHRRYTSLSTVGWWGCGKCSPHPTNHLALLSATWSTYQEQPLPADSRNQSLHLRLVNRGLACHSPTGGKTTAKSAMAGPSKTPNYRQRPVFQPASSATVIALGSVWWTNSFASIK